MTPRFISRRALLKTGAAALCMPALSHAARKAAQPPIQLALVESLSGPFANTGEAVFRNLLWATERVNQRGGVPLPGGARPLRTRPPTMALAMLPPPMNAMSCCMAGSLVWSRGRGGAGTEDRRTHADDRGSLGDGRFEVAAHAHRERVPCRGTCVFVRDGGRPPQFLQQQAEFSEGASLQ